MATIGEDDQGLCCRRIHGAGGSMPSAMPVPMSVAMAVALSPRASTAAFRRARVAQITEVTL